MLRKTIFWLHLITGVVAGLVVLTMSVTGVLLAFERQMTRWADGSMRCAPVGERMPLETLLVAHSADKPRSVLVSADPTEPVVIGFGREGTMYVNPYTGAVLGEGAGAVRKFFGTVREVHRWLGVSGENREKARAVTGACNLAFLFLVVSGPFIWWRKGVKWFKTGLCGKARDWNWHNVIGVWTVAPLLLIVLTGVVMSYVWANNLLFRLAGSEPPPPRAENRSRDERPTGQLNVMVEEGNGGRPDQRSRWTIDAATGEVIRRETYTSQNAGRKARSWARYIHTGEAAGLIGQVIGLVASAGAVVLSWTGLALAWRRFWAWRRGTVVVPAVSKEDARASCV